MKVLIAHSDWVTSEVHIKDILKEVFDDIKIIEKDNAKETIEALSDIWLTIDVIILSAKLIKNHWSDNREKPFTELAGTLDVLRRMLELKKQNNNSSKKLIIVGEEYLDLQFRDSYNPELKQLAEKIDPDYKKIWDLTVSEKLINPIVDYLGLKKVYK